jgi:phosphoribosylformimino-5-aminoimidazole carboxamide ribotide isomerase
MLIIPVIDILHGQVVRAYRGERAHYRPIQSPLCPSSEPHAVVTAFLGLHPFPIIYIADLDAIQCRGNHLPLIRRLAGEFPSVTFWVDAGIGDMDTLLGWQGPWRQVIGSESQGSLAGMRELFSTGPEPSPVLSLDFLGGQLQGPSEILERTDLWPQDVIVMGMDQIGGELGPDFQRLEALRRHCPDKSLFAAGGVRHRDDLMRLAEIGVTGALVASALHDGRIGFG